MPELTSSPTALDFPLAFEAFNPAVGRVPPSEPPPTTLREISTHYRNLLSTTLYLNRSSITNRRQTILDPGWVIRFSAAHLTVTQLKSCEDGEPYLCLQTKYSNGNLYATQEWKLCIQGPRVIELGKADSGNLEDLENLIAGATDSEALLSMAAILNPEDLKRLMARAKMRDLGRENRLPRMDPKKVKELLVNAGLSHVNPDKENGAKVGQVNLRSGKSKTLVAVAVRACPKTQSRPLTLNERYKDQSKGYSASTTNLLVREAQKDWLDRARAVLVAAGWREIPPYYYSETIYFTLVDENTWNSFGEENVRKLLLNTTISGPSF